MKMKKIEYKEYYNRVYGCWLGKCIAGTIGAPSEGRKELFEYEYDPTSIQQMLPNDDLDLQIVWLDVVERKGIYFTSEDLAAGFYDNYKPSPGEYAYFKKNYCRGIMPPVSGWFNNEFYMNGMGCPIRSEIWGCIALGNSDLAKQFSILDGSLDHGKDSVEGEIFFATLESEAFFDQNIESLVEKALQLLDKEGKVYRLLCEVRNWCGKYEDYKKVRVEILENWGHADCTNLYQNIGITLMSLLLGKGDFLKTTMMALNSGFDTDCTCATAGAILGILYGAERLQTEYGFTDTGYILEALVERRSNKISDLAEDTCVAGITMCKYRNDLVEIVNYPDCMELPHEEIKETLSVMVDYCGNPVIGLGETKRIEICFVNHQEYDLSFALNLDYPADWEVVYDKNIVMRAGERRSIGIEFTALCSSGKLSEKNIMSLHMEGIDLKKKFDFGLMGAAIWQVYGPFWHNKKQLPKLRSWDSYYPYFEDMDEVRQYHLNTFADIDQEYIDESDLLHIGKNESSTCTMNPRMVSIKTDRFHLSDYIPYHGSYGVYMSRQVMMEEERKVSMTIGHTAPFKLWINGEMVSLSKECDWWTAENKHISDIILKKGVNTIVLKATKVGDNDSFSLIFNQGLYSEHCYDLVSLWDFSGDKI